ncbi:hypothetical protein TRIP_E280247 [uncultured Spirochaetota bacterium]|uniref:Uncharacterized protein n=1 Tax=uncultured Spirochaetota bacterium TaxID=460511 RepID=A0A652ZWY4_9SPIR|nr:hypothetical protein TRIP_E280247 [uncultured Spirochaetota bacterium]
MLIGRIGDDPPHYPGGHYMARGLWHEGAGTLDQPGPSPGSRRRFFAIPTLIPAAFSACLAGIVASGIEVAFRSVPLYWFHRRLVGPDDGEMGRNAHVFQPCPKTFRQGAALAFPDIAELETFGFEPAGGSHGGDEALPSGAEGGDEISLGVERIHTVGVVGALGVYDFRGIISGEKDSTFLDLDKRIYRPGEPGECFGLRQAHILLIAEVKPIEITLLDTIEIDHIEPADTDPGQIHGASRPDAAEAVHRHAGGFQGFHARVAQEDGCPIPEVAVHPSILQAKGLVEVFSEQ